MMLDSVVNIRYVDRKLVRNNLSFTTTCVEYQILFVIWPQEVIALWIAGSI